MIVRLPRYFVFPLATFAFVANTVQYTDTVFTTTTRWFFLAILALYLVATRRLMSGLLSMFGMVLLAYCAWCLSTYSWSQVPNLSLAKAAAFVLVALTLASGGYWWVAERGKTNALKYLIPIVCLALFAGSYGGISGGDAQRGMEFYEGLTDNSNMLGSLLAMAIPLLLWKAYRFRANRQQNWIWIALLLIVGALLMRTYSRSAILSAGMLAVGFCLSLKLSRAVFVILLIGASLLIALVAGTAVADRIYQDYVLKGVTKNYIYLYSHGTSEGGIFYTREGPWALSWKGAKAGGWFGLGYGVSAGDTEYQVGLTSVGYGREKGNAQLAVVEETGLVGLGLYLILLFTLFARLVSAYRHETDPDIKVILGIVAGALAGLTAMSTFEAWWVSPGSPESAYFWSLVGVALALTEKRARAMNPSMPARIAQPQPAYSILLPPHGRVKG